MDAYWIWLAERPGVSDRLRFALLHRFPDAEAIYSADSHQLKQVDGMTDSALASLSERDLSGANAILEECSLLDIRVLTYQSQDYPQRLKQIPDPPVVLYYKGSLPPFDDMPVIGIVGTRSCSPYGMNMAQRMGYQISACGGLVVSGMAKGGDTAAMHGALLSGSSVVAVLGCGVDVIYPAGNRSLYHETVSYGCVLSEYAPGTPPAKWTFPRRNRIISGLSCGVVVTEAPEKSGTLITAHYALEQGRDVFVVPGNVDVASCAGSNQLLRQGAIAVADGWDVLSEYAQLYPHRITKNETALRQSLDAPGEQQEEKVAQKSRMPRKSTPQKSKPDKKDVDNTATTAYSDEYIRQLSPEEQSIASAIRSGASLTDDVIARSGLPSAKALSVITRMELTGVLTRDSGKRLRLTRK